MPSALGKSLQYSSLKMRKRRSTCACGSAISPYGGALLTPSHRMHTHPTAALQHISPRSISLLHRLEEATVSITQNPTPWHQLILRQIL